MPLLSELLNGMYLYNQTNTDSGEKQNERSTFDILKAF